MKVCEFCNHPNDEGANFCTRCGHHFISGEKIGNKRKLSSLAWVFIGLLVLCFIGLIDRIFRTASVLNHAVGISTGPDLLIARCGQPSSDESSEYENPRPPFPTRIVEYRKNRLRFLFVVASGRVGDPPPYQWKLLGITDMTASDPSK